MTAEEEEELKALQLQALRFEAGRRKTSGQRVLAWIVGTILVLVLAGFFWGMWLNMTAAQ